MLKILTAHWSKDKSDSHYPDDEDCSYLVINELNQPISAIFATLAEAKTFIKSFIESSKIGIH